MIKLDAKAEVTEAKLGLEALGLEIAGIGRKILRALATIGKKRVKARMFNFIHARTFDFSLTRSKSGKIGVKSQEGGLQAAVYGFARTKTLGVVASGLGFYAEILERGGTIRPKKGKFLTFRGDDGDWHRMPSVTIPAKHWFSKSIEGLEEAPEYQSTIDKVLGKAIQKAMKT